MGQRVSKKSFYLVSGITNITYVEEHQEKSLVALEFLSAKTVLIEHEEIRRGSNRRYCSYINDANFTYPMNFEYATLYKTFSDYISKCMSPITNQNNIIPITNEEFLIIKDIQPGESITRTYGIMDWLTFLWLELNLLTPFSNTIKPVIQQMTQTERNEAKRVLLEDVLKILKLHYAKQCPNMFIMGPDTTNMFNALVASF